MTWVAVGGGRVLASVEADTPEEARALLGAQVLQLARAGSLVGEVADWLAAGRPVVPAVGAPMLPGELVRAAVA